MRCCAGNSVGRPRTGVCLYMLHSEQRIVYMSAYETKCKTII
jgi:hypothetical protein